MRNYKQSTYEEITADRKFRLYKRISAGIGVLFVGVIIVLSMIF
jgi:hypothetical protein